jgi:hypothetical protein
MAAMERALTPCPQIPLQTLSQRWAVLPAWRILSHTLLPISTLGKGKPAPAHRLGSVSA